MATASAPETDLPPIAILPWRGSPGHDRQIDSGARHEQLFERADVDAILSALLDIRRELAAIRRLLEDGDGEEEAEAES